MPSLRSEQGFTLIELLVTMVAGIVVLAALLTILDVTLQSTTRQFSQLDANNRARPAFTSIENELHSACFADEETPIQVGSNANALIFLTSTGTGATPTETWHEIDYNGAPTNDLTDTTYQTTESAGTNGAPIWTRGSRGVESDRTDQRESDAPDAHRVADACVPVLRLPARAGNRCCG